MRASARFLLLAVVALLAMGVASASSFDRLSDEVSFVELAAEPSAPAAATGLSTDNAQIKIVTAAEKAVVESEVAHADATAHLSRSHTKLALARRRAAQLAKIADTHARNATAHHALLKERLGKKVKALRERENAILQVDAASRAKRASRIAAEKEKDEPLRKASRQATRNLAKAQEKFDDARRRWQDRKLQRSEQRERRAARRKARLAKRAAELSQIRSKIRHLRSRLRRARRAARRAADRADRLRSLVSTKARKAYLANKQIRDAKRAATDRMEREEEQRRREAIEAAAA